MTKNTVKARLAPSPTGHMHLGNAWALLLAWLAARLEGGEIILRIEDIDTQRSKLTWEQGILHDLAWLGIDYDGDIVRQSQRTHVYEKAISTLSPLLYPCYCTRKELQEIASAPQYGKENTYDNRALPLATFCTCRNKERSKHKHALRLVFPPLNTPEYVSEIPHIEKQQKKFSFHDMICGEQNVSLQECGGDFTLRRSDDMWAYQFAVSVDDATLGITQVVRGDDLLTSTPKQLYLFSLLGYQAPEYAHIPLLLDAQGRRLAKRHESLSLAAMYEKGIQPKQIITYLASLMGIDGVFETAYELLEVLAHHHTQFPWKNLNKYTKGIITKELHLL